MKRDWLMHELIDFEIQVADMFKSGWLRCPIHLSGGNEIELIEIFSMIEDKDYVFATHRNHYHYLLKGGNPEALIDEMRGLKSGVCSGNARSMNVCDPEIRFYTSAIVSGNCAIAAGVALGIKRAGGSEKVYCFLGDGAEDSGHYMEAVRFAAGRDLPIVFIVEDNNYSTDSTKDDRWENSKAICVKKIQRYEYERVYPHVGIGEHVTF